MVDSVFLNSGRGCINCSGIWASRHTRRSPTRWPSGSAAIQAAAAGRSRTPASRPSPCRAWPRRSRSRSTPICKAPGVTDMHREVRRWPRVVKNGRADYLRPTVVHCESPDAAIAKKEYMFPFVTVVECPQAKMLEAIGPTLVCTAITENDRAPARAARRHAHRPAEPRPDPDDAAQLAPAARRQHRRVPVSRRARSRAPACEDPVHHRRRGGDVLRQLPARQRAGRRAEARGHDVTARSALHADAHRRAERQRSARVLRRHQRLPAAEGARSSAGRRAFSTSCATRRGSSKRLRPDRFPPIRDRSAS